MSQPEARLVRSIKAYLAERGARAFKIHGGDNVFQEVGIPDLLVCYRGRFVGVEAKMPGNSPSRVQLGVIQDIEAAGGYAIVAESVDQVERLLQTIDREVDTETHPSSRSASARSNKSRSS